MDFSMSFIVISSLLASSVGVYGAYLNARNVRNRLKIERELTKRFAKIISDENLEVSLRIATGKLEVTAKYETDKCVEEATQEVREKIEKALQEMADNDKRIIMATIHQPSRKGQVHYLRKVANRTLDTLSAQSA